MDFPRRSGLDGRTFPRAGRGAKALRRDGLFVLVVGPDGSGKSTLARGLLNVAQVTGRPARHLHWRPGILPLAGSVVGRTPGDPSKPHGQKPQGQVLSLVRLLYYWIDFFLGLRLWLRPTRGQGELVVMERGWWDFAVDPLRYRLSAKPELVERLGRLLPAPDLVILLEATPHVLLERKRELTADELARQTRMWRQIGFPKEALTVFVDGSLSPDNVADRAMGAVTQMLMRRGANRVLGCLTRRLIRESSVESSSRPTDSDRARDRP
jgi:thymidylate kinase